MSVNYSNLTWGFQWIFLCIAAAFTFAILKISYIICWPSDYATRFDWPFLVLHVLCVMKVHQTCFPHVTVHQKGNIYSTNFTFPVWTNMRGTFEESSMLDFIDLVIFHILLRFTESPSAPATESNWPSPFSRLALVPSAAHNCSC